VLRRKSITILAAGLLSVTAIAAGCSPAVLTDPRQILANAVKVMTPDSNVLATTSPGGPASVHVVLDAGGQFLIGLPAATATPTPVPSASAPLSPSPSAPASASAAASASARATAKPLSSAAASASASAAAASASAATAAAASASAVASDAAASASASAAGASASASAAIAASASPTATPTPFFTALPFTLNQAHAEGDIDLVNKTAHITGWMPSIPGLSGELIVVDPYAYTRGYGATQYTLGYDSNLAVNPVSTDGAVYIVDQILSIAADPSLSPVLVGTEQEPSGPAYHIRVDVTPSVANDKLAASGQLLGTGTLNLWILQSGNWLERMEFSTSDPSAGAAAIRLVLSNFNGVAPITTPPNNQINTATVAPSA
jgi:hypothetical protein